MRYAIFDIDGTLSDCSWRRLFATDARLATSDAERAARWDEFHARSGDDPPHRAEVLLAQTWLAAGHGIIYLTGRPSTFRAQTQTWLAAQGLPSTPLIMREPGASYLSSAEYKQRQLDFILSFVGGPEAIAFIMDDHDAVVAMWRRRGFTCWQPRAKAH
jgi:hypothetical protein